MENQENGSNVLLLEDELLSGEDKGGEQAFDIEPEVLLLKDEVNPEPIVKMIDVPPRRRRWDGTERPDYSKSRFNIITPLDWDLAMQGPKFEQKPEQSNALVEPAASKENQEPELTDATSESLADALEAAQSMAKTYGQIEARTRIALYATLGQAYDFFLMTLEQPEAYAELLTARGMEVQDRAPFSPVVKLVFGEDYDRTRIAEFSAVISYCQRRGIARGECAEFISSREGGIKQIVELERMLRRGDGADGSDSQAVGPRPAIARKLARLEPVSADDLDSGGDEYTLVLARRAPDGHVDLLGAIPRDVAMLEKAARKLLAEHKRPAQQREPQD